MKEEEREMEAEKRSTRPREVGGILSRIIGAMEAEERMNRMKFRHDRRRFGKEHELLSLEEAIEGRNGEGLRDGGDEDAGIFTTILNSYGRDGRNFCPLGLVTESVNMGPT
ncbi:hypothetical protein Nepgr_025153 [Nepenthes gracilis]|uniref:Uncharacterized protein n=1 Tax=Nepenthes gracilis TaxID=150966 RepID=A0AAD3Y0T2_NEPGR|nr:hypothetical protein Nepgr_025153 [Nepenthes gracilis]